MGLFLNKIFDMRELETALWGAPFGAYFFLQETLFIILFPSENTISFTLHPIRTNKDKALWEKWTRTTP